jgi:hypothetical protein
MLEHRRRTPMINAHLVLVSLSLYTFGGAKQEQSLAEKEAQR